MCFYDSGIKEITLPSALRKIGDYAFENCSDLKTIYVEDGCEATLVDAGVPDLTSVIPISATLVGGMDI